METMRKYSCIIASKFDNVSSAVSDITYYLKDVYGQIEECNLFEIKVILNELILNAIKHGNKCDCSKNVKVTAGITRSEHAFFMITDEGSGYDYQCMLEKPQFCLDDFTDICDIKETGRGIMIVKNLTEKLKFNRKGNKVLVIKKLVKA